jgi:hypothetical protein
MAKCWLLLDCWRESESGSVYLEWVVQVEVGHAHLVRQPGGDAEVVWAQHEDALSAP